MNRSRHLTPRVAALGAALLLAGCINESASFPFSGRDHALTLDVRQKYPWSGRLEVDAVMIKLPDCHRRTRLDPTDSGAFAVEVIEPQDGAYAEPILILKQGERHYALGRKNCEIQRFAEPPRELGPALGRFSRESGRLQFIAAPKPVVQGAGSGSAVPSQAVPAPSPAAQPAASAAAPAQQPSKPQ